LKRECQFGPPGLPPGSKPLARPSARG
jgi:hypothetical protein